MLCQPIASSVTSSAKKVMEDHNSEDRIVRTGRPEGDIRTGQVGKWQSGQDWQDRTGSTGPPGKDSQEWTVRIG